MKEKVDEIINKLENEKEIKRIKELRSKLNKNEEYLNLMNNFIENKENYIKDNVLDKQISILRKKLFSIKELEEYLKLQNGIRILSIEINNIIVDVLN